ncbi:interleukin-1 receptor-associated kinase 4-like [Physella acuta]|uniref:interleukin-1 receptor-associated kinase 4-like n=1 Tax=Physella acuta TaxID=109671 RepID=UPI0027DDA05F|nr:interleukin-1 receptor-associated kinase 4-like [Physella acuta]XP_059144013.1 interleukin-1 receptor-associated kinase 4-like [Physella acuta]
MGDKKIITEDSYVRHLPFSSILNLSSMLDTDGLWEQLAVRIPTKPDLLFNNQDENFVHRYTQAHVEKISRTNYSRGGSCTKFLLMDWGTQNCKVKHLIEALVQAKLVSAADYLRKLVTAGHGQMSSSVTPSPSERTRSLPSLPSSNASNYNEQVTGVCRPVPNSNGQSQGVPEIPDNYNDPVGQTITTISVKSEGDMKGEGSAPMESPTVPDYTDIDLKEIRYDILRQITNNFDTRNLKNGGNLIGEGGFGTVFLGMFNTGFKIAVKCLKDDSDDCSGQFKTEVETLCKFKHENLVYLLGYSLDGDTKCLIYQYMSNGSLEDRLACLFDSPPLSNNMRLHILTGTARGIDFLHKGGLIHRDIKSANILLDAEFNPRVGDFATAKLTPSGMTTKVMKATTVIGTAPYLAPEAFNFTLHNGLDCFSFGVVILEVLTGLPVCDPGRETADLKLYVQEFCCCGEDEEECGTIHDLLDKRGGEWDADVVEKLYALSCRCLECNRKLRPKMSVILTELESLGATGEAAANSDNS